jgi:hypothetical protein
MSVSDSFDSCHVYPDYVSRQRERLVVDDKIQILPNVQISFKYNLHHVEEDTS